MYAARNPGSWANGLKICTIDAKADQRIAIGTDGLVVGYAITAGFSTSIANTDGTVGVQTGYVKGIITDIGNGTIDVKVVAKHNVSTDVWSVADYEEGSSTNAFQAYDIGIYNEYFTQSASANQPNRYQIFNNAGTAQRIERTRFQAVIGIGSTVISFGEDLNALKVAPGDQIKSINGTYSGNVTDVQTAIGGNPEITMDTAATVAFANTDFIVMSGVGSGLYLREGNTITDWYKEQTLSTTNSTF